MSKKWFLYGTLGCHLCEEAAKVCVQAGLQIEPVEICDDADLMERFALHIPVLASSNQVAEAQLLTWPFDVQMVKAWISQQTD